MGDARHQARKSDHNQGNAVDITHDPASGCDGDIIAAFAIADARVKYVIWNHRIHSRDSRGWRKYSGSNPHTKHCHISIKSAERTSTTPWGWRSGKLPAVTKTSAEPAATKGDRRNFPGTLRLGMRTRGVKVMQQRLHKLGWAVDVDGYFGPQTRSVVVRFQRRHELGDDGVVGRKTWTKLWE